LLSSFWSGIADQLAQRWISVLVAPAFVFWVSGLLAFVTSSADRRAYVGRLGSDALAQGTPVQVALLVAGLIGLLASGMLVKSATLPLIRLMEGYWPRALSGVRKVLTNRLEARVTRWDAAYQPLARKYAAQTLTAEELETYIDLDEKLNSLPADQTRWMPTRLGNILRAGESRPYEKYRLDSVTCWPRLWFVLPNDVREEISRARSSLDDATATVAWALLFIAFTLFAWWAPFVGAAVALFAYTQVLSAATLYGQLTEAAFDNYRADLYRNLRFPLPANSGDEVRQGEAITQFLRRGPASTVAYTTESQS
jgi:hypothetical protein